MSYFSNIWKWVYGAPASDANADAGLSNSSNPSSKPATQPSSKPAAPERVSEGAPNPDRVFTLEQLKKYDGTNPSGPIYLCCNGKVFDVTKGAGFYGPGGGYNVFAGKDASRALAKMDLQCKEFGVDDLSVSEKQTLKEWVDKFEEKYPIVGKLIDFSIPNSGPKPSDGNYTAAKL